MYAARPRPTMARASRRPTFFSTEDRDDYGRVWQPNGVRARWELLGSPEHPDYLFIQYPPDEEIAFLLFVQLLGNTSVTASPPSATLCHAGWYQRWRENEHIQRTHADCGTIGHGEAFSLQRKERHKT
jgi:hypothetical protein